MELSRILNEPPSYECEVYATLPESPIVGDHESGLRVGKWTEEEEFFAVKLIKYFLDGSLSGTPSGISLRSFLAKQLRCSPMRISTKLAMDTLGGERIPKRLGQKRFFPMDITTTTQQQLIAMELYQLEVAFLEKENLDVSTAMNGLVSTSMQSDDDSMSEDDSSSSTTTNTAVRVGSWSDEEQSYAAALIDGFLQGLLNLDQGVTLRAFLAERLCCNPMRISKKLSTRNMAGQTLPKRLGSATFQPARGVSVVQVARTEMELSSLRNACFSPQQTTPQDDGVREQNDSPSARADSPMMNASWRSLSPSTKKREFSQVRPMLPSLMETCKKARQSMEFY